MKKSFFEQCYPNGNVIQYAQVSSGTCFHRETPDKLIHLLEKLRREQIEVRVFYGDTQTGQSWLDEQDVIGRIGRSTGTLKIPLLVAAGEMSGGGLLDHCMIRMDSRQGTLYRHPKFRVGDMTLTPSGPKKWPWQVLVDGKLHASFQNNAKAIHWMNFIQGHAFALG
jgi:hypothetical protein